MHSNWSSLPDGVLDNIGRLILNPDMGLCRLVCKTWIVPLTKSFKKTFIRVTGTRCPTEWGSRLLPNIEHLVWESPPSNPVLFRYAPMDNIASLEIVFDGNLDPEKKDVMYTLFGCNAPLLQTLDLEGLEIVPQGISIFQAPCLSILNVANCKIKDKDMFEICSIKSLTDLNIMCNCFSDNGMLMLSGIDNLLKLDISMNAITDSCLSALPDTLKELDISSCDLMKFEALLKNDMRHMTRLKTLHMNNSGSLSEEFLEFVPKCIKELYLVDCGYICFPDPVLSFTSLTELSLINCGCIFDTDIANLPKSIVHLNISGCSFIDLCVDVDLPNLETLDISKIFIKFGRSFWGMPRLNRIKYLCWGNKIWLREYENCLWRHHPALSSVCIEL
jgi:Leucine-rich repeat (LRR) protein